jgi:hypothetical protein
MNEHSSVASWEPVDNDEEYLYLIKRTRGLPDVRVHLSDAYEYSRAEYLARPAEVTKRNSFVVLGDPHAISPRGTLVAEAGEDGVGIGDIGKFMGALNSRNVWEYQTPLEGGIRRPTLRRR